MSIWIEQRYIPRQANAKEEKKKQENMIVFAFKLLEEQKFAFTFFEIGA